MGHGRAGICGISRGVGLTKTMRPAAGAVVGRIVRRPFVIVGLLGVVALVCSGCAGGAQHLGAKPVDHHAVARVKTTPATSTTRSRRPRRRPPQRPPSRPTRARSLLRFSRRRRPAPAPRRRTDPFPPACVWSNFVTRVSTDQGTYAAGAPVQIALVFENTGPACTVNETGYACPVVNIDNAAGALVWSSAAPASTGCPSTFTGPTVLAANWSQRLLDPVGPGLVHTGTDAGVSWLAGSGRSVRDHRAERWWIQPDSGGAGGDGQPHRSEPVARSGSGRSRERRPRPDHSGPVQLRSPDLSRPPGTLS